MVKFKGNIKLHSKSKSDVLTPNNAQGQQL